MPDKKSGKNDIFFVQDFEHQPGMRKREKLTEP